MWIVWYVFDELEILEEYAIIGFPNDK